MAKNYTLYSKKTGRRIMDFVWFPGMRFLHETLEQYVRRRWPRAFAKSIYA